MTITSECDLDDLEMEEHFDLRDEIEANGEGGRVATATERARIEAAMRAGEIRDVTVEQALDLEARLAEYEAHPELSIPWEEALARLRSRR